MIEYIFANWPWMLCIVLCVCLTITLSCISVGSKAKPDIKVDFEQYKD
jgi:hypothetical protein